MGGIKLPERRTRVSWREHTESQQTKTLRDRWRAEGLPSSENRGQSLEKVGGEP